MAHLFPVAIGVLTSSLGVGDCDISRFVAWGVIQGVAEGVLRGVGINFVWEAHSLLKTRPKFNMEPENHPF